MASLQYAFSDLYTKVAEQMGLGSSPTGTDLTNVKAIVNRGYRRFLLPLIPDGQGKFKLHRWKFLKKTATLSTRSGEWRYQLPEDYSSMIVSFRFVSAEAYINPVERDEGYIIAQRRVSTSTSYPCNFAIRSGDYDPDTGQLWEVIFDPCPNSVYDYYYTYRSMPAKLVNDADIPVGGSEAAECIMSCALAAGELQEDEKIGIQEQTAQQYIMTLIASDNERVADTVGYNGDSSILSDDDVRPNGRLENITYTV